MARLRKLTPAKIRKIFQSRETAQALGTRFGISQQMVYLIRSGRAHAVITRGLNRGKDAKRVSAASERSLNVNRLADAIVDRLIKRLKARR